MLRAAPEIRFWQFVTVEGDCWLWTGGTTNSGYGKFRVGDRCRLAHRWVYEFMVTEIPDGLTIDHLCRRRLCVNPWHLEPVTMRVNTLRSSNPSAINAVKENCPRGHVYDMPLRGNRRGCRTCHNATSARTRARTRARKKAAA